MRSSRTKPARSDSFRFLCLALCAAGALLLTLTLLSGCGGDVAVPPNPDAGSVGAPPPQTEPTPTAPIALTASLASVKRLTLNWSWSELASVQRAVILEDPDADGPLPAEPLAEAPASDGTATVEVFLPITLHATYQVALCTGEQCRYSAPLRIEGNLAAGAGRIKAMDPTAGSEFGASVALSQDGRVLAIGAMYETVPVVDGSSRHGAVHLFERGGPGQWTSRGQIQAPNPGARDRFGSAVALSANGQVLAVSASEEDALGTGDQGANNGASGAGAVYIFRRQADQWVFEAYLKGSEVGEEDGFGTSLSLSGDGRTLAVGAPADDGAGDAQLDDGAVYVFSEASGSWTETRLLRDSTGGDGIRFGQSVALSADGTALAIGSPRHGASGLGVHSTPIDGTAAPSSGAVYLFRRSAMAWALEAFVKPPQNLGTGEFGHAVALDASGDTLLAGARQADLDPNNQVDDASYGNSGSAHVFVRTTGQWAAHGQPLRPPRPKPSAWFGQVAALSADGRTALIGTHNSGFTGIGVATDELSSPVSDFGAAYVFRRQTHGWGPATVLKPSDRTDDTNALGGIRMGQSVAVSGDGRTVAVGAGTHDGPGAGLSTDPTIDYDYASGTHLVNSGTVFLY